MTLQSQREIIVRPFDTDEFVAPMQGDAGDLDNESDVEKDEVIRIMECSILMFASCPWLPSFLIPDLLTLSSRPVRLTTLDIVLRLSTHNLSDSDR